MTMDMSSALKIAMMTPGPHGWGIPSLFIGMPGVAKTALGEREAHKLGLHAYVLIGSQIEAPDLGGYPAAGERFGKRCLDPLAPFWIIEANHLCETTDKGVVLILDELNTCPPPVQAAMLRVVNERMAGGVRLHPRIRIIAFMNPPEIAAEAGGVPIAPAMSNRVGHFDWVAPTIAEYTDHIMGVSAGEDLEEMPSARAIEESIMSKWHEYFVRAAGETTAYLSANSKQANSMPASADDRHGPWPSYRSWENAMRHLAGARLHGSGTADQKTCVAAHVSKGVADEFFVYLKAKDIPDAGEWMARRVKLEISATRMDVAATVLRTSVALLTSTKDNDLFVARLAFLLEWYIGAADQHSSLVSNPLRKTLLAWRDRTKNDRAVQSVMVDKHLKLIERFRKLPLLASLEDLGILNPGTAQR